MLFLALMTSCLESLELLESVFMMSLLHGMLVQANFSSSLKTEQDHVTLVAVVTASLATVGLYCDIQ